MRKTPSAKSGRKLPSPRDLFEPMKTRIGGRRPNTIPYLSKNRKIREAVRKRMGWPKFKPGKKNPWLETTDADLLKKPKE